MTHTTSTSPYNMYIYGKHELLYHIACVWSGVSCSRINTTLIIWKSVGHTRPVHLCVHLLGTCVELLHHSGFGVEYLVPQSTTYTLGIAKFRWFAGFVGVIPTSFSFCMFITLSCILTGHWINCNSTVSNSQGL